MTDHSVGVPLDGVEFYCREHRGIGVLAAHHELFCSMVGWPHDKFHAFCADIEENFLKTVELAPTLVERVRQGRREERLTGTADLPNF